MALTFYLSNTDLSAGILDTLTKAAPSVLDEAQGWTVATKAAPNFSIHYPDTTRAASTFVTTEPSVFSAYGYRTTNAMTGRFDTGTWALAYKVKSGATYYAMTGTLRFRLWRSVNANGSGATQITAGWTASATISWTAQNQYKTGTITSASITGFALAGEYLFLELEWSATVSGGNSAAKVYVCVGEGAAENLTTPAWYWKFAGSVGGQGNGAATGKVITPLAGSAGGTGNAVATGKVITPLAGSVGGQGNATMAGAEITPARAIAGSVGGQGNAAAAGKVIGPLAGSVGGKGNGAAAGLVVVPVAGAIGAKGQASTMGTIIAALAGAVGGGGEAAVAGTVLVPLAGDIGGQGNATMSGSEAGGAGGSAIGNPVLAW